MDLKVEIDSNLIFIKMGGSLVASSCDQVRQQVQKLVEKRYTYIVFDMSRVDFVDSSGLGVCIATARELTACSGRLVCFGLRENVKKLFAMTRADQKIVLKETRAEAFDLMMGAMNRKPGEEIAQI
jgi:anti-sigma B factor antagonist